DDDELTPVLAGGESGLRLMSRRGERQREVEHVRRTPRGDQAKNRVGGIREAGHVPPLHWAEHLPSSAIDRERAGEVDDDLVVSVPTELMGPTFDECAGHRGIEDATSDRAPSDPGVHESAGEQEVPAQVDVERAERDGEVSWLYDDGPVREARNLGSADPVRH